MGISKQHLIQGSEMLKSIYKFHVYYTIRRIFQLLRAPIPHERWLSKNGIIHLMPMLTTKYALNMELILGFFG